MKRFVAAACVAVLAMLVGAAPAGAIVLDDVAEDLRNDPVYVAQDAERRIDQAAIDELKAAIGRAGTPIYIAVLPDSARDSAGGDAGEVARQLAERVDRPGTFGILVGESLRAGSNRFEGASRLAAQAVEDGGDDTAAVLNDFVRLVGESAASGGDGGGGGAGGDDDGGVNWVLPVVLVLGAGALGFFMWQRSKRRRAEAEEQARQEAADRQLLAAELSVLADDVVRLEPEVLLHPDAQGDFDSAVNRYRAAQAALDAADEPIDLIRVERVVLEARYSMDRTRAIVDGRPPPDPPAELRQPGRHGEPAVTLDEDRQPAYVGYPGGFQGGWFGGAGGGLFSGMLLGSMLGWGFGGWGYGGGYGGGGGGNEGGGGDGGGDGGGGDWGGGDFGGGGGDFGGGDFGGGDFGGGDFGG